MKIKSIPRTERLIPDTQLNSINKRIKGGNLQHLLAVIHKTYLKTRVGKVKPRRLKPLVKNLKPLKKNHWILLKPLDSLFLG